MKTYTVKVKGIPLDENGIPTGEPSEIQILEKRCNSMAEMLGHIIQGDFKVRRQSGVGKRGKILYCSQPLHTHGRYKILEASCAGMNFPEVIGRAV